MGRRRRVAVWWLASAGTLLVILVAALAYFATSTVASFVVSHPVGCLPSDFPVYAGAKVREIDQTFDVPGSIAQCRTRLFSRQLFQEVNDFYRAELVTAPWETTAYAVDIGTSTITFDRRSHPFTRGVVSIFSQQLTTEIDVQLTG